MSSRTTLLTFGLTTGLAALLLCPPALAGKVYQWKDAKGVTHFSDSPPPDGAGAKDRHFNDGPATAKAETKEDPNCVRARQNLERLRGDQPVGLDANGDGVPDKEMTVTERAQQVQQMELTLKTQCQPAATKP